MDSYPDDLLVGVTPLVFAVNCIFDPNDAEHHENAPPASICNSSSAPIDSSTTATATTTATSGEPGDVTAVSPKSKNRSDFDRFLDAMAGSLVADESDDADMHAQLEFQPIISNTDTPNSNRNVSLFRPDDDDMDESTDEDLLMDPGDDTVDNSQAFAGGKRGHSSMRLYAGFGLTRRSATSGGHAHSTHSTSYAKALQHGQGFFQRARIVSISSKHGFPPSKDPAGTKNITFSLKQARVSPQKAKEIFTARPIQGILPAGWLEKHVYALPSVLLVVVKLKKTSQSKQDYHLLKTVENLHYSLVSKRPCKIHVVALVDDDIAVAQAQQWSLDITRQIVDFNPITQSDSHQITLLRSGKDLRSGADGFPTSVALRRLHRSVRDSSLLYYLGQARRNKEKLARLSEGDKKRISGARQRAHPPRQLLPLAIRYCFKIAIFYEFQLKFEKSLKFMAEAYRHVRSYYHYLIRLSARGSDLSDDEDIYLDSAFEHHDNNKRASGAGNVSISTTETEEMEVSITDSTMESTSSETRWASLLPAPPSDMAHQCLAVADWLNFKLLQAGFGSHTEGGLVAADEQVRQHTKVFLTRRFFGGHPIMSEDWYFWCHVAQQRLVMSQLVERHPPRALGDFGNEYDELLLRCTPWRAYEAAAEAFLKAHFCVADAMKTNRKSLNESALEKDDARAPFIGGLDKNGVGPLLEQESKVDHKEKAFELLMRAISLFEHEWGKEKIKDAEDQYPHRPWGRFGARLYYLAGGILLGKQQFSEASSHLEKAAKYVSGWTGLEVAVRRLLAECYEKSPPVTLEDAESNQRVSTLMMEAFFYTNLSSSSLMRALVGTCPKVRSDSFQWSCGCFEEFDSRLPFSYSVTFPKKIYATAGDSVAVSVWLKSNLDYVVAVESITLLSMAGNLSVPAADVNKNNAGGVTVIKPMQDVVFETKIALPKSLDDIKADESASDKQGKSSYTKSARPRTSGITSAAGARLVSEDLLRDKPRNGGAQWSLNFLGGKPLRCEGIRLLLRPCDEKALATETLKKPIELTIDKKKSETPANIKRTPFEEDNYISSAWCSPLDQPLPKGPRSLRVAGPVSEMEITNMTQSFSDGRAVEGTVNRICLKLQAGLEESCVDIKFKIRCTSTLVTKEGTTKTIALDDVSSDKNASIENPDARAPILVCCASRPNENGKTAYGVDLPIGWQLLGSGQESNGDLKPSLSSSLACGDSTFIFFELYRPAAVLSGDLEVYNGLVSPKPDICQTDFVVTVSYKQERRIKNQEHEAERSGVNAGGESVVSEFVSQKYNGAVIWTPPIMASFQLASMDTSLCGSRHPSNLTDEARPSDTSAFTNIPMIDGARVSIRTVLEANAALDSSFLFEVMKIRFEKGNDENSPCKLHVAKQLLYEASTDDPSHWLLKKSKLSSIFTVQATMINKHRNATFPLGEITVEWRPRQFELPGEVASIVGCSIDAHGPLTLSSQLTVKFQGPMCYIEKAPFKTTFKCNPPVPKVLEAFEVVYEITNDTSNYQKLSVLLDGNLDSVSREEILVCGLVNGDFHLAPHETQTLTYTAVATKAGITTLPKVFISSARFNSWVVNEMREKARPLCILP